jgi:hypothetical protein
MESFAMLVLVVLSLAVLGECYLVFSQLLQADAIRHIVVQAVKPPAAVALREPVIFPFQF